MKLLILIRENINLISFAVGVGLAIAGYEDVGKLLINKGMVG